MVAPGQKVYLTIAGLSNSYSHYVTTFEEYQAQRYEAASTLYGTFSTSHHLNTLQDLTLSLVTNKSSCVWQQTWLLVVPQPLHLPLRT